MLNIGIIGMGVGEKHAFAYQAHTQCNLKSLCDFDTARYRELKIKFPDQIITDNYQSILNDETIDIVSIASYDNYHANQIIESIKSQKHVFAEKPLCLTRKEMQEIHHALELNPDLKLSSNLVLRTNPRFQKIKDEIKTGSLGDIYYLEGDYYWGRIHKFNGWRSKMDFFSIIHGACIHMIDLVMWIISERPIEVQAVGNDIATRNTPLKFNSFAALLLKFESGIIAKITGNGGCIHPHFHGLKVFGTKTTAIQSLSGAYWLKSSKNDINQKPIKEPYPAKEFRKEIITSYIDHILNESKDALVSQKDVFNVMSVCFAAEEAMSTGNTIQVNYLP